MLSLYLFGGLQARLDEEPLAGRAAHRKRLALLALLATTPSRTLSRDKLVALLWPEHDGERARHQLATALYDLRKAAGEDTIVGAGNDLRLNPACVTCDVWAFETDISGGECERAVPRYTGPLLDGFFLSDAPEFERWVDGERDRLARLYAQALEELAAAAEAKYGSRAATQWWRRLAAHEPFNSRVALGLMDALSAAGDPATAIQHASIHGALLREELGAEPNPEVVALAERLRAGVPAAESTPRATTVPSAPASAHSAPPSSPEATLASTMVTADIPHRRKATPGRFPLSGGKWSWAAAALGTGSLLLAASTLLFSQRGQAAAAEERAVPTVAVLPLKNDTGDPRQEHFADAMTEALIAELAREGRLRVISRTSVMPYKDPGSRRLPEIARDLNADLIVVGSVFRAGDQVRITAQLIRASTDEHLWAESYEGSIKDIFALQGTVAQAVAGNMGVRLTAGETKLSRSTLRPVEPAAYEAYLQARQAGISKGVEALQHAIALDPEFAPAYAALADKLVTGGFFGIVPPDSAYEGARRAARQALAKDGTSAEAHGALAMVLLHRDWNWIEAERHFRRALALNPSNAYLRHTFAHQLLAQGRRAESAQESARAAQLDPFNTSLMACSGWHGLADGQTQHAATESLRALRLRPESFWPEIILGWAYEQEGKYPEAISAFRDAVSHSGGISFALAAQAHAHAVAGEGDMARAILSELHQRSRTGYVSAYDIAAVYAGLGEKDQALQWLERAYQERSSFLINLAWEPRFQRLRSEPRFQALIRKMGLPIHTKRV